MRSSEDKRELTLSQAFEKYGSVEYKNRVGTPFQKIFEIMIYDELYPVYDIGGYEHDYGKWNGCPTTWWLDYSKVDTQTGEREERELVPYIDKGVHRVCWEIHYKQSNTTKHKWDELNIRSSGVLKIMANGKHVYTIRNWDLDSALTSARATIEKMVSSPYDFLNPEKENGRKIWYYNLPATVRNGYEPGEIGIEPDYSYMSPESWWSELERRKTKITPVNWEEVNKVEPSINGSDDEDVDWQRNNLAEYRDYGSINHGDAFSDGNIWWFRD